MINQDASKTTPLSPDQLLRDDQVALYLNLRNSKTPAQWRLRRQGPPFVKVGRLVRYSRDSLLAWVASNQVIP